MPRRRRLDAAGVPLHVIQRGNNRAACFFSDIDRRLYLKCLADAARRRGCAIHAYALMTNHVHLLLTPEKTGSTSLMLQDLGRKYVPVVNRHHDRTGTLWEGRFRSNLVDSETYLLTCHRYIELNPVRAGMVARPADYPWTSHRHYARTNIDPMVKEHRVFTELGSTAEDRCHNFLELFGSQVNDAELDQLRTAVNKGWALGSDAFLDRMEAMVGRSVRPPRRGRPRKENDSVRQPAASQEEMLF